MNVYRTAAIGDGKRARRVSSGVRTRLASSFDGSGQVLFGPKHESGAAYLWIRRPTMRRCLW